MIRRCYGGFRGYDRFEGGIPRWRASGWPGTRPIPSAGSRRRDSSGAISATTCPISSSGLPVGDPSGSGTMSSSDRPDLLLTYDFPPMGGGIARTMLEVARHYPDPGLVVSTGTTRELGDPEGVKSVHRLQVPSERLRSLPGLGRWTREVLPLVPRYRPPFVWVGNIRPAATVALRVKRLAKVPYGLIVYGGDLLKLARKARASPLQRWRIRRELSQASALVAISDWTATKLGSLARSVGARDIESRLHTVLLGSDPDRFRSAAPDRLALPAGRWLLSVGRLVPHKGVDVALEAFVLALAKVPDLRFAIVGDGPERDRLVARARSLGCPERVHWLGAVPDAHLPALYAMAEVYVGLSREEGAEAEGFGLALVDASAASRPIVAGRSGGIASAVRDGETGLLVDPTSATEAARAIAGLLADPDRAVAMGAAGRRLVERHLNWTRVAADLARISRAARSS